MQDISKHFDLLHNDDSMYKRFLWGFLISHAVHLIIKVSYTPQSDTVCLTQIISTRTTMIYLLIGVFSILMSIFWFRPSFHHYYNE